MIIEGLLTTEDEEGAPHAAAMGPVVNEDLTRWTLRPFQSSKTFQRLRANPHCAFHVVDDVLPVVQAALGFAVEIHFERSSCSTSDIPSIWIIPSACHWFQLRVTQWDVSQQRSSATAEVLKREWIRPFWGWNRAKHAVLEATILATRLHLMDRESIDRDIARLEVAVVKTAGQRELQAWSLLQDYFASH